jgi:hypothetical protein
LGKRGRFAKVSYYEEGFMKKTRSKVSFDAMVKFFMQQYDIPTKKDVNNLIARIDRLEKLIKATARPAKSGPVSHRVSGFAQIQAKTGFGEKKLRNVIFRLNDMNKIKRKSRGIYISS